MVAALEGATGETDREVEGEASPDGPNRADVACFEILGRLLLEICGGIT